MKTPEASMLIHRVLRIAALVVACLTVAAPVLAQSAAVRYQRAQAREADARKQPAPSPATLRSIAVAYETIVRRYPASGYADNALWQAALLLQLAHERGHQPKDLAQATRMLQWLAREYPTSALAKQAAARLAAPATRVATVPPRAGTTPPAARTTRGSAPTTPAATATPPLPNQILPAPVTLTSMTRVALPKGDRLTLELSEESMYTTERVQGSSQLRIALPNVGLSVSALEAVNTLRGSLFQSIRLTPKNGGTEILLQLTGQPRHSAFPLYAPYRLVIDVESDLPVTDLVAPAPTPVALKPAITTPVVSAAAPIVSPAPSVPALAIEPATPMPAPPASTSRGGYSLARQLGLGVSRIVIDPGHGGHDPGAQANGVSEADLVLDVALRLEKVLQAQPGFEVVLTRRTNEFVPLEQRTAIANRESADLFLSIHANSSPQKDTRGIETYFLNFASNSHAEAVAARENAATVQSMRILPEIVKAIAMNNKLAESRELAGMVQSSLFKRMQAQSKSVKDLGVKQAPFVVLIGAQMPSVLAEIAFISNRAEAALLKQTANRQRIAQALGDAVLKYQSSLKKVATVATIDGR